MEVKLVCTSHSPLIYFPASETAAVIELRGSFAAVRERVARFDPDLVVMFGCDHYGGHQMASMPAFCVGTVASSLNDVGGTPGELDVPRELAVKCVDALRENGVDVAVSYAMEVDHGFSQALKEVCGEIDRFPVLPLFICCLQPPFVPFKRARAFGTAVANFLRNSGVERLLIIGTGGLSHDPEKLFPAIDDVDAQWRPYHLLGSRQSEVTRQAWMDYEKEAHVAGAAMIGRGEFPLDKLRISDAWDEGFLDKINNGDLAQFDAWTPPDVIAGGGFGAMEVLTWVAAVQAADDLTGCRPSTTFYRSMPEVAVGFGIAETGVLPAGHRRAHVRAEVA